MIKDRIKELRRVKPSVLRQNPKNWHKHPDTQKHALTKLLEELGFVGAAIARELPDQSLLLLDGHLRQDIGIDSGDHPIPVLVLDVTEEEADKILATYDPIGHMATLDKEALKELYEKTTTLTDDFREHLAKATWKPVLDVQKEADAVPALMPETRTKPNAIYSLGPHRVFTGSCTEKKNWEILFGNNKAQLLLTDPPYGVSPIGSRHIREQASLTRITDRIENNEVSWSYLLRYCFDYLHDGHPYYVFHSDGNIDSVNQLNTLCPIRQALIWVKNTAPIGRQDYHNQAESIALGMKQGVWEEYEGQRISYGWQEGKAHPWYGDRKQKTVIGWEKPHRSDEHPTQKPVGLLKYLMNNSSKVNDIVCDPFLGSGSTLVAAHDLGRVCYGFEVDLHHCDVILKRFEEYTGMVPTLVGDLGGTGG